MKAWQFRELQLEAMRRPLTATEQTQVAAYLAAHPADQAEWEQDQVLREALDQMPEVRISNNFTARVMQALDLECPQSPRGWHGLRPSWLGLFAWQAQVATTVAVVGLSLLFYGQYRAVTRARLAESLATVAGAANLPSDVLQNLDAITLAPSKVDAELLAALQ